MVMLQDIASRAVVIASFIFSLLFLTLDLHSHSNEYESK